MKKVIMILAVIVFTSFSLQSCKEKKKEAKIDMEVATMVYQCPMECEENKAYTKAGKCRVCDMDLVGEEVKFEEKD